MRHDAIVIGGSFAGLSAAMQLARANRTVAVIDTGQPRNRFATAAHGFFAEDGVPPLTLMAKGRERLAAYPSVRFVDGEAIAALPGADGFTVELKDGEAVSARKVVLAFGIEDRLPPLPGLAERWGRSVIHCPYCHGYEFLGRPIGVLGVAPQSVHQAELVREWGPVTLFLNGLELDAASRDRLLARGVAIEPVPVVGLEGEGPDLAGARLADGRLVPIAALYIASRTVLRSPIAAQLGCAIEDGPLGPVVTTDAMQQTSVPGVYAAGDIARPFHNATLASADGVIAGTAVHRELVFGE